MRYGAIGVLVLLLGLVCVLPPRAAEPAAKAAEEPLADRVRKAIDKGIKYLRDEEDGRGQLDRADALRQFPGGLTSLGLLALLTAGVPPEDPLIQRCLKFLRDVELNDHSWTYV